MRSRGFGIGLGTGGLEIEYAISGVPEGMIVQSVHKVALGEGAEERTIRNLVVVQVVFIFAVPALTHEHV